MNEKIKQNPWMDVSKEMLVKAIYYSSDKTREEIADNLNALI